MKVIKVVICLIIVFINIKCSSYKSDKNYKKENILNSNRKNLKESKRQSTDELRNEQMQDYENDLREIY